MMRDYGENNEIKRCRGVYSAYSDTYVEWLFECRCDNLKDGNKIFMEWCHKKEQYISIMSTIALNFQHYSRHDESHSVCIIQRIEQVLGRERINLLSTGDLWLILQVAYSHDIGMALTHEQVVDLWKNDQGFKEYLDECLDEDLEDLHKVALFFKEADNLIQRREQMEGLDGKERLHFEEDWPISIESYLNILISEYVRKYHAFRAKDKGEELDPQKKSAINPRLYAFADEVVAMHARNFDDIFTLKKEEDSFEDGNMHPQFVAVLLRLGDLLDIDNNRFDPYFVEHFGRLPSASLLHMKKHKAITHICVSEGEISVEAETDEYMVAVISDSWFKNIEKEVENLICYWNQLVPKKLIGCRMKKSICKTFLCGQLFDSSKKLEFSVNKERLIDLLIGTSVYQTEMECIREYIQNSLDASKVQLWIDLENGKYDFARFKNEDVLDNSQLTPFDLDRRVYENYQITISVEWNEERDKIRLSFHDNGIGIEREYMEKLSTIGTGWHGRTQYANYLHKMAKWLRPTGGFGIGMQSAFMVSDSVEIRTKSDKDICGYKVILNKKKKDAGTVAITESEHWMLRGTLITYEVSPEKFQSWMRGIAKKKRHEIGYLGEKKEYGYSSEEWDEFDEEGNLMYVVSFLKNYIQAILPNSLFPIAVKSSITKEIVVNKAEWPEENYWEQPSKYIEIEHDGKAFLGLDVSKLSASKKGMLKYLVWNKTDNILVSIKPNGDIFKSKICYKNIIVRDCRNANLGIFSPYTFTMDIMGIPVKKCLHLHRNSFLEKFDPTDFIKKCFWVYILFLEKTYKDYCLQDNEKKLIGEEYTDNQNYQFIRGMWCAEWCSYWSKLICIIEYPEMKVNLSEVLNQSIKVKRLEQKESGELLFVDDEVDAKLFVEYVQKFYCRINGDSVNDEAEEEFAIVLSAFDVLNNKNNMDGKIRWQNIYAFIKGKLEFNNVNEKQIKLLKSISNIGVLNDRKLLELFRSDNRLKESSFSVGNTELIVHMLEKGNVVGCVSEKELVLKLWDTLARKRVMLRVKEILKYKELQVKELPFSEEEMGESIYVISPLSCKVIHNVNKIIRSGVFLDYEKFRYYVWGERGQESSAYHMLINWVFKNQVNPDYFGKTEIRNCYEELLNDIYKEHIFPMCKKGK